MLMTFPASSDFMRARQTGTGGKRSFKRFEFPRKTIMASLRVVRFCCYSIP